MARFEGRISPLTNVNPPVRVIAADATDKPNIVLQIGKGSGSLKTFGISGSHSETGYMDKQQKEVTTPTAAVEV